MMRATAVVAAVLLAAVAVFSGCKKSEDSMLPLLALLGAGGPEVYAGSSPEGHFVEISMDRENWTIDYTDYTDPTYNLSDLPYVWLDPAIVPDAGGFSILYRAELPNVAPFADDDYILCVEIRGVALVVATFDGTGEMKEPPTFAFKRRNVSQSEYYKKAFNWLHVTVDDEDTKTDMMCGFVASDSSSGNNGRLYGAEYSIQDNEVTDLNPGGTMTVGNLEKDAASGALVGWMGTEGDWDNAIVMIGDPDKAMQIIFGPDQGGGGAFAVPQASSKDFQTAYAGTYAALLYQYDTGAASGEEESVQELAIVITPEGGVRVYNFGDNTDDPGGATPLFEDDTLDPVADYDGQSLADNLNATSLLASASFAGIKSAYLCNGAFIAEGSIEDNDATAVIIFDPEGRFAGFHLFDTDSGDDILGFGLAAKDEDFINPD